MKQILLLSFLLILISCDKNDGDQNKTVTTQDFEGTWTCERSQSSFQIKIGAGPTVTSFSEIPAPGYTTRNKYSVISSSLSGNRLLFVARLENPFVYAITEFTCSLVDKNTLKSIQVIKHDNVIIGSSELIYKRRT